MTYWGFVKKSSIFKGNHALFAWFGIKKGPNIFSLYLQLNKSRNNFFFIEKHTFGDNRVFEGLLTTAEDFWSYLV